jgi:proline iminopeptidase
VDQNLAAGDVLHPPLEPRYSGMLAVGGGHQIYFEESGNPAGYPVLFLHGGPGSRSRPAHRRFFDPDFYRIVLFDQRGCGRSTPAGSIIDNTTAHLVEDVERLRRHLGIERWLLFGGSWGSTLALACAIRRPETVAGLVLRGVFLASRAEVRWYLCGMRRFLPDAWQEFAGDAGTEVVAHYRALLDHPDPAIALAAARRWSAYESRVMAPAEAVASGELAATEELLAHTRVQLHYLEHDCFLMPGELLDNLRRVETRPAIIVQGRLDMVCPPQTAFELAQRLPQAELRLVADGGHSALAPAIARALCQATADMRGRLGR